MISVVIRNKNEASNLKATLNVLRSNYNSDISEIILVDNESIDNSVEIAKTFNCIIITIKEFTYGKAINLGIEKATNDYVLLLSSHAIPIGASFFKTAINVFNSDSKIAGLRFINSFQNYKRAKELDFTVKKPLSFGLMAACAMVNKKIWNQFKFDEKIEASEDKIWSALVTNSGYKIKDVTETYFYFAKRNEKGSLLRYKIETIADYKLHNKSYPSILKMMGITLFNMTIKNCRDFWKKIVSEYKMFKTNLEIRKNLKT